MIRGDLVTIVTPGHYGKPRPALIIQSDSHAGHPSITVLPLTTTVLDAPLVRITIEPGSATGLRHRSQVMIDKAVTVPRAKVGPGIGRLDPATLGNVGRALAAFLDLGSG